MGTKYSTQATSGYNSSPPPDDGTQVAANLVTWAGVKTKLADVLKTFAEAINTALVSALDLSARAISVNDTAIASDHWKTLQVTGATTITLSSAASMGAGYEVGVFNAGASTVTVTPGLASDTINNLSASVTIPIKGSMIFRTNQALTGYNITAQAFGSPLVFGAAISATQLTLTTAISKILPGATSISLRNTADTADNLLITDAGAVSLPRSGASFSVVTGRLNAAQGSSTSSANSLTLPNDGNRFQIVGTTQINLIDNTSWQSGSFISLHFQGSVTVKHNQAASGNFKPIMLSGAVDFGATASDQLTLIYDGVDSKWYEQARTVI